MLEQVSGVMLFKRELTSRLSMINSESGSAIFLAKTNEFFRLDRLLVKDYKKGTRNFANL